MSIRAAIASTDGKVVNEHFGRAARFFIFELDSESYRYIEERAVDKCCDNGEHDDSAFEKTGAALKDCSVIVFSKIGYAASIYMESLGFELYEAGMFIEDVLKRLTEFYFGEERVTDGSDI